MISVHSIFRILQTNSAYSVYALAIFLIHNAYPVQDTQKQAYKQQIPASFCIPTYFHTPLEYSHSSFKFFLTNIYNHRSYPQHFLALNPLHIISGIALAPKYDQPRRYMKEMLTLFDPKMLNIFINPYAFSHMLASLPPLVAPFCNVTQEKKQIIESIKQRIGSCLVDEYSNLKRNPEATLNRLSHDVYALTSQHEDHDIAIRELQHAFHYFLARGLSNLVWSPAEQQETWTLVKTIGCQLEKCVEYYMIDEEFLDDLFWVLLKRFAYFIDMCASDLTQPFFDAVYHDLKAEKAALWLCDERKEYITPKLAYLQNVLMEAEIKSKASSSNVPAGILHA